MFYLAKTFKISTGVCGIIWAVLVAQGVLAGTATVQGVLAAAAISGVGAVMIAIIAAVGLSKITSMEKKGKKTFIAW